MSQPPEYPPPGGYGPGGYDPNAGGQNPPQGGWGAQPPPPGGYDPNAGGQNPPQGGWGAQPPPPGGYGPPPGGYGAPQDFGGYPQPGGYPPPVKGPGGFGPPPPYGQPIPTYLWQSIACTLLCCLPAGIAAIVFATKVQSRQQIGDYAGALEASAKAKTWCIVSFGVGLAVVVLGFVLGASGALDSNASGTYLG
ncbi:CD225/dispanin family protein [Parafrankia sp. BMG5.11]|uniref:CD225/dispanin family protein n=1 Tax=Parafrankia sp. BMG5.11 TaxID=222540 RepID=UPI00103B67DD|nr:CD225/dispanin family protein [Parafrankia sp. BMG5.11]TCJ38522.1 CD225/dispanin family protein [Parafrankia sp. BMG5.11]CAI7978449.1 CD225/dispanin family protein [Frankia sp. Hr75.2]